MIQSLPTRLDRIAKSYAAKPSVSAMSFAIDQPSTGFTWGYGSTGQPFFIASITKLYTVAITMQLRHEGVLALDTRVASLLGDDTMRGLVVHDGHDHGPEITVRELLSHTSGIPDYFEQKRPDGTTFLEEALRGDAWWGFEDFMELARGMPSRLVPSAPRRAQYSDTNYELLGRIIEVTTGNSFHHELSERVIAPLGLDATWLLVEQSLGRYDEISPVLYGSEQLHIPKTIASSPATGAVISTPIDQLRFFRAFVAGELFPARYLTEMTAHWNPAFSRLVPLDYGIGIMRFRMPRWQSPLVRVPQMIGHSESLGTVLYHAPERDLYISGTVNQMRFRSLPYPLLSRLAAQFM